MKVKVVSIPYDAEAFAEAVEKVILNLDSYSVQYKPVEYTEPGFLKIADVIYTAMIIYPVEVE